MPKPTLGSVHNNAALDNVAIAYTNKEYTLGNVFPTLQVKKESDLFYTWNLGDYFRNEAEIVAAGAVGPRGGFAVSTTAYTTKEVKFSWPIPDRVRNNMDTAIAADISATRRCMDKIMLYREVEMATFLTTAANWTGEAAAASAWDVAAGTPIADVITASNVVKNACGRRPNTAVINRQWANNAMATTEIRDLIRYTGTPLANMHSDEVLRQVWNLDRLFITDATYDSAVQGQTSVISTALMSDNFWIGYVPVNPALDEPSAAYTFMVGTPRVRTFREDAAEQDVVEAASNYVVQLTSTLAGTYLSSLAT